MMKKQQSSRDQSTSNTNQASDEDNENIREPIENRHVHLIAFQHIQLHRKFKVQFCCGTPCRLFKLGPFPSNLSCRDSSGHPEHPKVNASTVGVFGSRWSQRDSELTHFGAPRQFKTFGPARKIAQTHTLYKL